MRRSIIAVVAGIALGGALAAETGLRLNTYPSMPTGLWAVHDVGAIRRGDIILACPHLDASLEQAKERRFIRPGIWPSTCPSGLEPMLKVVVAVPGDVVEVPEQGLIKVNGEAVPNSEARKADSRGRSLIRVAAGIYEVKDGEAWLLNSYSPLSFDSRYFGPVKDKEIVAAATPIIVGR